MNALLSPLLRDQFPLLARQGPQGRPLIYLDSAATALKPRAVVQAVVDVLSHHTANVHRSVHLLGDEITEMFEDARRKVARLIGAEPHEVILLRNTTEGLNLVAQAWPRRGRILVSLTEHHSNLLPWGDKGVTRILPRPDGTPDEDGFLRELGKGHVAILVLSHVSNVTGHSPNVTRLADATHAAGAIFVLDGAQSVPHGPIDVQKLDCDFLAFSSHKLCGPSGIGALYGKAERLAEMDWVLRGGGTVESVENGIPVIKQAPWRFEAGTPAIEATVGFGAAVDFLQNIGLDAIAAHGQNLTAYALNQLRSIPGFRLVGPKEANSTGIISFTLEGAPSHLIARALSDCHGICVRSGYHCAQPLHEALQLPITVRMSLYLYNQAWEIDAFCEALASIRKRVSN